MKVKFLISTYKVKHLTPDAKKVDISLKILKRTNEKEVTLKKDNSRHRVCTFIAADDTGTINLNIWDDVIDLIHINDKVQIKNGYVREFQGQIYLNIGRFGTIETIGKVTDSPSKSVLESTVKIKDSISKKFGLNLLVKVAEISEIRTVTVKKDNSKHELLDVLVGDETGCVILTLWDKQIPKITGYNTYQINNAYLSEYNGGYRLNISRNGSIHKVDRDISVNLLHNLSLLDV